MPKRLSEANGNGGGRRRTDKKILFYTIKIIKKYIYNAGVVGFCV